MSDQPQPLSYAYFNHLIVPLGAMSSPSELHGLLCGKLCGGARPSADTWQQAAIDFLDLAETADSQLLAELARLRDEVLGELASSELDFAVLLPEDDAAIDIRAQALAEWCHGFLNGFGSAGIGGESELSAEVAEALRDLAAMVALDTEGLDESAEQDLFELSEYVRVCALTLFSEFQPAADKPSDTEPTVH